MSSKIKLFWFSKEKLQNSPIKNFGDDLNPMLINKITGHKIIWKNPASQNIFQRNFERINFAVGSILHFTTKSCNIWGSGLIDSKSKFSTQAKYFAVRGPQTYRILKSHGCNVPDIFGDPAILLPKFFQMSSKKEYKLGIIPHYTEIDNIISCINLNSDEIKIINLQDDNIKIINEITSCERILSSSLHGIIVAMAYGIPVLRITLSDNIYGDGIKYNDFYESVGISEHPNYKISVDKISINELLGLFKDNQRKMYPAVDMIVMQEKLLSAMPF